jgi:ubiquinone/menaquinone biosynthesis C-methylase UbiE
MPPARPLFFLSENGAEYGDMKPYLFQQPSIRLHMLKVVKTLEDKSEDIGSDRRRLKERAERYDQWCETFRGAVGHYVDWHLLRGFLPQNRDAKILDAAGGTGRITLPLAKMGYSVTLCDISPEMLNVAKKKLLREGLLNKVEILECDVATLRFADESFDFVIFWDGMIDAAKELIRVTKSGGKISIFLVNRPRAAISKFRDNPYSALALLRSESNYFYEGEEKYTAVSIEEARQFFENEGIKIIDIYAVYGMLEILSIPEKILESRSWDERFFRQVTEMLLTLSREPSVKGLSRHLVLYGEKI